MKVYFSDNDIGMNDEKLILICLIGLFKALKCDNISIDEAEKIFFSPRIERILQNKNCSEKIIDVIKRGCELEDIESLVPEKLEKIINELMDTSLNLIKDYPCFSKEYWLEIKE